jgi:hypothetical protein
MKEEYQKGQRQFQEWLRAHKGYSKDLLKENALWTLGVRKESLPGYKPRYQPCTQAWIDELNKLLQELGSI